MDNVMKCLNSKVKVFTCNGLNDRYIKYLSKYFNCERKIKHTLLFNGVEETCMYVDPKDYFKAVVIGCDYLAEQNIPYVGVVSPIGEVSYNINNVTSAADITNSRYIKKLIRLSELESTLQTSNSNNVKKFKFKDEQQAEDFVESLWNK